MIPAFNPNQIVIALSGWRGSGKDTVADYLCKEHGFVKYSFAAYLKDMVAQQYNIKREFLDDRVLKEAPITSLPVITTDPFTQVVHDTLRTELSSGYWTPRALCILEGSIKRSVHANYWVQRVVTRIQEEGKDRCVISDLRYRSEVDTLRLLIPTIQTLRINRFTEIETIDPSERDLDYHKFDATIYNTKGKGELYASLDYLLTTILLG